MKKPTCILGLNYLSHDSSASLLRDGEVIASAMEERFTRVKQDRVFPMNAINFCLAYGKITIADLECITFYMDPEENFEQKMRYAASNYPQTWPIFNTLLQGALDLKGIEKDIRDRLQYFGKIYFCNHHDAHIAESFFLSEFQNCAMLVADGLGEITSTVLATVDGNQFTRLRTVDFPHSLGMLYNALTHYLGFNAISDPGKVMGLSSYGDSAVFIKAFRKIVKLQNNGTYELDLSYFEYPYRRDVWISEIFSKAFGPRRLPGEPIEKRHEDIAAALQLAVEEAIFHMAKFLKDTTKKHYLCLGGGVALNSVANGKLLEKGWFKDIFVPPAPGDDGTSIGSALYYHYCVLQNTKRHPLRNAYLGTEYSNDEILKTITKFRLVKYHKSINVCKETAALLTQNKIIGWFQGRMEIGPRALGNRSIIANPGLRNAQDILNARVKFREPFRPFAPSILVEEIKNWFSFDHSSAYMLFVFDIKKEKRGLIPGVTHVDGSGRLQSVGKSDNPRYYKLISEFNKLSGIPMVINTSFNVAGEPIIESPAGAIRCFLGNGLDYLVMGDYILEKHT